MADFESSSASRWRLSGCLAVLVVVVAGLLLVAAALIGYWAVRDADRADTDPERLRRRAGELVGGELPAGWHPAAIFELPGVLELVVLGRRPATEPELDPSADARLVLVTVRRPSRRWQRFVERGERPREALEADRIVVDGRIEGSGSLDWAGTTSRWLAIDGPVRLPGGRDVSGRSAILAPACSDRELRLAIWRPAEAPLRPPVERAGAVPEIVEPLAPCW